MDRDIEVDYEPSIWMGNDVLGLGVKVGNTVVMQKCDTLYQLLAKIHNLAAKHSECESMI